MGGGGGGGEAQFPQTTCAFTLGAKAHNHAHEYHFAKSPLADVDVLDGCAECYMPCRVLHAMHVPLLHEVQMGFRSLD